MQENLDWHIVVERYLAACYDDRKSVLSQRLANAQARFLREHASELVSDLFNQTAERYLDSLLPYPATSQWVIVEEDENRVVVEIPSDRELRNQNARRVPYERIRILLMKPRDVWQIHDLMRPCSKCNFFVDRPELVGKCFYCKGPARSLSNIGLPCSHCDETGRCPKCIAETVPGWRRALTLGQ